MLYVNLELGNNKILFFYYFFLFKYLYSKIEKTLYDKNLEIDEFFQ